MLLLGSCALGAFLFIAAMTRSPLVRAVAIGLNQCGEATARAAREQD